MHWQRGIPLYHMANVTVHAHLDLGVDPRKAYECVGLGWEFSVFLAHVPFGEATKDFWQALALAYERLSLLAPMHHPGLIDLTTGQIHALIETAS